jgi:hypothetical protein
MQAYVVHDCRCAMTLYWRWLEGGIWEWRSRQWSNGWCMLRWRTVLWIDTNESFLPGMLLTASLQQGDLVIHFPLPFQLSSICVVLTYWVLYKVFFGGNDVMSKFAVLWFVCAIKRPYGTGTFKVLVLLYDEAWTFLNGLCRAEHRCSGCSQPSLEACCCAQGTCFRDSVIHVWSGASAGNMISSRMRDWCLLNLSIFFCWSYPGKQSARISTSKILQGLILAG